MTKPNPRAGLSVLELLLSLALLALIATALSSALSLALQLRERSDRLQVESAPLTARIRLRLLINDAMPPTQITPFPGHFEGNSAGFSFTTLAVARSFPDAAALRVTVKVQGVGLVLQIEEMDDDGGVIARHNYTLLDSSDGVVFDFYDLEAEPPAWTPEWRYPERLPRLVRITSGTQAWPDFVAHLTLSAP